MVSQSLVNEIDVFFFGRLPIPESSYAQAALLPSLILTWLYGGSLSAISVGTQALVARRYAEGNRMGAGAVLGNAAFFCVVAGVVFSVLGLLTLPWLVRAMIHVPEVQDVAIRYTRWRLYAVVSMSSTAAIKAFFDGIGKTYVHLVAAVLMNVCNVALCWTLIFGHLGLPAMGAPGAGLSAFIATWIGLGVMLAYSWIERADYHPMRWVNLSGRTIWLLLKLSVPAAMATVVMMVGFGLFARTVGKLDGVTGETINEAANTDIIEALKLTFTACMAFGTATATLISQALGRKGEEAQKWGWASVRLGLVVFGVVGLLEGVLFAWDRGRVLYVRRRARGRYVPESHHWRGDAPHRRSVDPHRGPLRRGQHALRRPRAVPTHLRLAAAGRVRPGHRARLRAARHLGRRVRLLVPGRGRDDREVRGRIVEDD